MSAPEDLAAVAASLAETAESLAASVKCIDHWFSLVLLARREGYEAGLADASPQPRGQRSTAALQALPGGNTARKARAARTGGAR